MEYVTLFCLWAVIPYLMLVLFLKLRLGDRYGRDPSL